jgi:hypothetical protein
MIDLAKDKKDRNALENEIISRKEEAEEGITKLYKTKEGHTINSYLLYIELHFK